MGINSEFKLTTETEEETKDIEWKIIEEAEYEYNCGPLLHLFVTDLQLHLETWYKEYTFANHYAHDDSKFKF